MNIPPDFLSSQLLSYEAIQPHVDANINPDISRLLATIFLKKDPILTALPLALFDAVDPELGSEYDENFVKRAITLIKSFTEELRSESSSITGSSEEEPSSHIMLIHKLLLEEAEEACRFSNPSFRGLVCQDICRVKDVLEKAQATDPAALQKLHDLNLLLSKNA